MDAAGERVDADERRGDVGRLGVVDVEHAVDGRDLLEPVLEAAEGAQAGADGVGVHPARERHRRGGHRVLHVVVAAQAELGDRQQRLLVPPQLAGAVRELGARAGAEADAAGAAAEVLDAEAERRDRDRLVGLAGEDLELGRAVGVEGAVAVQVVLGEVEQDGGLGREGQRVLELERGRLGDDRRPGRERARQRGQRRADVAGHLHGQARLAVQVADQLDGRGLAVGAGDGDELVLAEQPPPGLVLAEHGDPALAGGRDHRRLLRHAGALDQAAGALELLQAVGGRVDGDAGGAQALGRLLRHRARVDAGHLTPALAQRQRRGHARAGEADDEVRAGRERRARDHGVHSSGPGASRRRWPRCRRRPTSTAAG